MAGARRERPVGDLNEPDLALALLDEQIQLCEALDLTELWASGIHDLAVQLRELNPARSRELLLQAQDAFRRCRYPIGDLLVNGNLGDLDREAGQFDSALARYRAAQADPMIAQHPSIEAWTLHGVVRASALGGLPTPQAELARLRELRASPHLDVQVEVVAALSLHLPPGDAAGLLRGVLDRADLGSHYRAGLLHEKLSGALEATGDDRGALRHLIRIPFVSLTTQDSTGLPTSRPEPVFLPLAPLGLNGFVSHSIGVRMSLSRRRRSRCAGGPVRG